jgi:hypothetical protein
MSVNVKSVGFEVLTAVVTNSRIFCIMLHRTALPATCFRAGFLLGLFLDPEDGVDMYLRNVGWRLTDYTALYPRKYNSSQKELLIILKGVSCLSTDRVKEFNPYR